MSQYTKKDVEKHFGEISELFDNPTFDEERREANNKLLMILFAYLSKYPQLRFNQALLNLEMVTSEQDASPTSSDFYVEPTVILQRVQAALKRMGETL